MSKKGKMIINKEEREKADEFAKLLSELPPEDREKIFYIATGMNLATPKDPTTA